MGTPEFSVPILSGLMDNYEIRAVVTQPDRQVGRGGDLKAPPVKDLALQKDILVLQPEHIKDAVEEILDLKPVLEWMKVTLLVKVKLRF